MLAIPVLFIAGILIGLCIAHGSWLPLAIDIACSIMITKSLLDIIRVYGRKKYEENDLKDITW